MIPHRSFETNICTDVECQDAKYWREQLGMRWTDVTAAASIQSLLRPCFNTWSPCCTITAGDCISTQYLFMDRSGQIYLLHTVLSSTSVGPKSIIANGSLVACIFSVLEDDVTLKQSSIKFRLAFKFGSFGVRLNTGRQLHMYIYIDIICFVKAYGHDWNQYLTVHPITPRGGDQTLLKGCCPQEWLLLAMDRLTFLWATDTTENKGERFLGSMFYAWNRSISCCLRHWAAILSNLLGGP